MKPAEAVALARRLTEEHLDFPVYVTLNNRKKALGVAKQGMGYNEISLSRHYLDLPEEEVRDTILHEIAHLKAGVHTGHGRAWRAACRAVGARPERLAKVKAPPYTYRYYCPRCTQLLPDGCYRKSKVSYLHNTCKTRLQLVKMEE